ncbi:hypothetical protein V8J36_04165 [Frigidibacter sp. MR17.14]|uniref:hypothetical protein n=1 Tax=Frigidibacter sp. MR17.14 TaxID=3126509 RepID=UPI003012EE0B
MPPDPIPPPEIDVILRQALRREAIEARAQGLILRDGRWIPAREDRARGLARGAGVTLALVETAAVCLALTLAGLMAFVVLAAIV